MDWREFLTRWRRHLLELPCPVCDGFSDIGDNLICSDCREKLPLLFTRDDLCPGCGGVMDRVDGVCSRCTDEPPRLWDTAVAVMSYRDEAGKTVRKFKFGNRPDISRALGHLAAEAWRKRGCEVDLIVPIPITLPHLIIRSYNQSALIAGYVGRALDLPVYRALHCRFELEHQAMRNREQRHAGLNRRFSLKKNYRKVIAGKRVLLIDDILTTGATLSAAAKKLLAGGAAAVAVLVIARS